MGKLKLIVISGLPGSGKSTVAEELAKKLTLPLFSVDPIESAIIKSGIPKGYETGLAAYVVAEALTNEQLRLGLSVIIDAVNAVKEARDMWQKLAEKHEAIVVYIECVLDAEIHKTRIEAHIRNLHGIPEVTWEDVEKRRQEYVPWNEERLILDTAENREQNVEKALKYINAT